MYKYQDLTGMRFGRLTVLRRGEDKVAQSGRHEKRWVCKCDCGNEALIQGSNLKNGHTKSCGCAKSEVLKQIKNDLTGQRFGRLVVIGPDGKSENGHTTLWKCICDCGAEVTVRGTNLKSGATQSCGCYEHDRLAELHTTHGGRGTLLYSVWASMLGRCRDKNNKDYGGRGITVCDEWESSFPNFREWALSSGYKLGLTIDRIDNNKGYSPDNCRWVGAKEQALNRRSNRIATLNGETHTFYEWDEILGFTRGTISQRVTSRGWSIERALTEPIHTQNRGRWLK